jgi:SNF2 family DNA or RNA helicase
MAIWLQSRRHKHFGLLTEMGTGKTKIALDTAAYMYDQGWINAQIVFGNKGSYTNWVNEIETHLPSHIKRQVVTWSSTMTKTEQRALDNLFKDQGTHLKILLMNVEALVYERSLEVALQFTRLHDTLAIMDESTLIKNPKAKRTKNAWKVARLAVARRILTGSVVDNRPLDCWAQYEFLKPGALGFTSYYAFRAEYAELKDLRVVHNGSPRLVKTVAGYKNLEELRSKLLTCSVIVKKEDCIDLPPKIYQTRHVPLTPEQRDAYNDLADRSVHEIRGESLVTTKIVLTKLAKLQQVLCGFVIDDNKILHQLPSHREEALQDVLEDSGEMAIIWAVYRYNVKTLVEQLTGTHGPGSTLAYWGDSTKDEREEVKKSFKSGQEGLARYCVSNLKSGAYGNTWTAATLVVYFSNMFDGELRNQSEDRCHRVGQTRSVTYVDLVTSGTVDEKCLLALKNKKDMSSLITRSNWEELFTKVR